MSVDLGGESVEMVSRVAPFLDVDGVSAGYNKTPIVQNVSIQVGLEEIVLIMGPNGAGKSTLIKAVTGELPALEGSIKIDGVDVTHMGEEDRVSHGVGYVPQVRDVFPPLTVQENIEMGGYAYEGGRSAGARGGGVLALPSASSES
ncbi:branched-chain amino acid ABC transporter ATP-binding protein [mine drainage metagenome]|uniref:Branched-chain amino acid ABC transporter ATP-binding protein n=1 Tax=mine drainage metagenome TaxID=410659 RepID=T0ZCG0_9ZZZZ